MPTKRRGACYALPPLLFILLVLCVFALPGCLQTSRRAAPSEVGALSGQYAAFDMGGVGIKLPLPNGYAAAPSALREAAANSLTPPEQIFGVYRPADDARSLRGSGAALLEQRKYLLLGARPEFMREIVDRAFFAAMRRDFVRTNGTFAPERLAQFRALTANYYARDDAFKHSLGVAADKPGYISIVRIVRLAGSRGRGAASLYEAPQEAPGAEAGPWQGWDSAYFARAYHQVLIQNVLLVQGRCLNIYFAAPLAGEADVYAAVRENAAYMEAVFSHLGAAGAQNDLLPTRGLEQNAARGGSLPRAYR